MMRSKASPTASHLSNVQGEAFLPWIDRGLEGLWLLAVFLVPLMFLSQDYIASEAQIAYVEVPKVALLRTVAGLMALLWMVEWAIGGGAFKEPFRVSFILEFAKKIQPHHAISSLNNWLKVHPGRWLLLSAGLFFGSTAVSTILSGSFHNSMWGEIPGQDGYSAYTIASYFVLFGVITTHLNNKGQLGRLLGAIITMGVLVGLYGTFQHFGHDFLSITESTGGGATRVTAFMGNTIFAGAVLSMTVPLTLVTAAFCLHGELGGRWNLLSKIGKLNREYLVTVIWAVILAVQLLGLMFTYSRGPWGGAVLALAVFLVLVVLSVGWRLLIQAGLVLGLAGIISIAFLHWQGSVAVVDAGPWLGLVVGLLGLAFTFTTLFVIQRFRWAILVVVAIGITVAVVSAVVVTVSVLPGRGTVGSSVGSQEVASAEGAISERISSVKTDVLDGFGGGRGTHWKVSGKLIKNRPWFEFDNLGLTWLRPLIGYGPDLFRYTYLLESPPDADGFIPLEPDHAHNFIIHQTVEQGIIGGLASLALFGSVFGIGAYHLLYRRKSKSQLYKLLLLGLTAVIFGRFLEMMVGVARISDLTVLWVLFALVAVMVRFNDEQQYLGDSTDNQAVEPVRKKNRGGAVNASNNNNNNTGVGLLFRLAIVVWAAGGIGVVTWQYSINNVRAAVAGSSAIDDFNEGNLQGSIQQLDKAIRLAPGVPTYYNNRAQVFLAYQAGPEILIEPGCAEQKDREYLVCLAIESWESNLDSVNQQPFYFRARVAAGNSAFNLRQNGAAITSYSNATKMVPNAWGLRNDLAESLIDAGIYQDALVELDASLEITGDTLSSTRGLYLKARALQELGLLDDALVTVNRGLSHNYGSESMQASLNLVRKINSEKGVSLDIDYFNGVLDRNPGDGVSYYLRGLAHLAMGNYEEANKDIQNSFSRGLILEETRVNWAYVRLKIGDFGFASGALQEILRVFPQNALAHAYYGDTLLVQRKYSLALNYLDDANRLDADLGVAYLLRAKIMLALGIEDAAKEILSSSVGTQLLSAPDYANRGELHAYFGDYDLARSDLNDAISINPNRSSYYSTRGNASVNLGDFESALLDLNSAIQFDPEQAQYFVNRGVIYYLLGEIEKSAADFEIATSIGGVEVPSIDNRNASYFIADRKNVSTEREAIMLLKFRTETELLNNIE